MWGFAPALRALGRDMGFVPFVIGTCIVLYVLTAARLASGNIGMGGPFHSCRQASRRLFLFGASGAIPVFESGRWWTVLSAGWLHGGLLHILFNMMAVRQLAPAIAELYGPGRMVIIYMAGGGRRLRAELVRRRVPARHPHFSRRAASPSAPRRRSPA